MTTFATKNMPRAAPAGTGSMAKAFDILDAISRSQGFVSARDLIAETGIARPTLYRMLSAMALRGIVRNDPQGQGYQIGYRMLDIVQQVWASSDLSAVASAELRRLRDITGETAYLAVLDGEEMLTIGRFSGPHGDSSRAELGSRKPLHCTAQGKAMMAFRPEAHRVRFLSGQFDRLTSRTLTGSTELEVDLDRVRARSFAIDDEEICEGLRCVASPVLDDRGYAIATISVAVPTLRLPLERIEQLAREVLEAAEVIGAQVRPRAKRRLRRHETQFLAPATVEGARSPVWNPQERKLYWIDGATRAVFTSNSGDVNTWSGDAEMPRSVVVTSNFGAFVAQGQFVIRIRDQSYFEMPFPVTSLAAIPGTSAMLVALRETEDRSVLHRLSPDGRLASGIRIHAPIDAMAVSRDGWTAALASTERHDVFHLSLISGKRRVLARIPPVAGAPAGVAYDKEDRVWIALRGGWCVTRLAESGEFVETLPLPSADATGLCFGGVGGDELFVTLAPDMPSAKNTANVLYFAG